MKKTISLLLCLLLILGLAAPALALESGGQVTADAVVDYGSGIYTVRRGDKYGFYRTDGTELVPPTYRYSKGFSEGMAVVTMEGYVDEDSGYFVDGKYGYVDAAGKLVIPMVYDFATNFSEGRAFVMNEDGPLTMIDTAGKTVAVFPDASIGWAEDSLAFHEGLAILPQGDFDQPSSYIAVNTAGKTVLTFTEAYVDCLNGFQDGMVMVSNSGYFYMGGPVYVERSFSADPGSCGYRDKTGKLVVDYKYDDAYHFSGGMGPVGVMAGDGEYDYGFIDTTGREVVPTKYDNFYYFTEDGVGTLFQDGRRAYVDKTGKLLTGFDFDATWSFNEGLALTRSGGGIRVFDTAGKLRFQTNCTKGYSFMEGLSVLVTEDGRSGAVDKDGKVRLPFEYRNIISSRDGFLWTQKTAGVWEILSTAQVLKNQPDMPFADVGSGEWYFADVAAAYRAGLVNGKNATAYAPKDNVSLAESVSLAVRVDRLLKGETGELTGGDSWYAPYVQYAKENGFEGVEFSSYGTAATRAQFAVIMANVLKNFTGEELQKNQVELGEIPDVTGSESYGAAVYALYRAGIVAGSNGVFRPGDNIQRSEVAAILNRFIDPSERLSVKF